MSKKAKQKIAAKPAAKPAAAPASSSASAPALSDEVREIRLSEILPPLLERVAENERSAEIREDISASGRLLEKITVCEIKELKKFRCLSGGSRLAAVKSLGKARILCVVVPRPKTEMEELCWNFKSNELRSQGWGGMVKNPEKSGGTIEISDYTGGMLVVGQLLQEARKENPKMTEVEIDNLVVKLASVNHSRVTKAKAFNRIFTENGWLPTDFRLNKSFATDALTNCNKLKEYFRTLAACLASKANDPKARRPGYEMGADAAMATMALIATIPDLPEAKKTGGGMSGAKTDVEFPSLAEAGEKQRPFHELAMNIQLRAWHVIKLSNPTKAGVLKDTAAADQSTDQISAASLKAALKLDKLEGEAIQPLRFAWSSLSEEVLIARFRQVIRFWYYCIAYANASGGEALRKTAAEHIAEALLLSSFRDGPPDEDIGEEDARLIYDQVRREKEIAKQRAAAPPPASGNEKSAAAGESKPAAAPAGQGSAPAPAGKAAPAPNKKTKFKLVGDIDVLVANGPPQAQVMIDVLRGLNYGIAADWNDLASDGDLAEWEGNGIPSRLRSCISGEPRAAQIAALSLSKEASKSMPRALGAAIIRGLVGERPHNYDGWFETPNSYRGPHLVTLKRLMAHSGAKTTIRAALNAFGINPDKLEMWRNVMAIAHESTYDGAPGTKRLLPFARETSESLEMCDGNIGRAMWPVLTPHYRMRFCPAAVLAGGKRHELVSIGLSLWKVAGIHAAKDMKPGKPWLYANIWSMPRNSAGWRPGIEKGFSESENTQTRLWHGLWVPDMEIPDNVMSHHCAIGRLNVPGKDRAALAEMGTSALFAMFAAQKLFSEWMKVITSDRGGDPLPQVDKAEFKRECQEQGEAFFALRQKSGGGLELGGVAPEIFKTLKNFSKWPVCGSWSESLLVKQVKATDLGASS